MRMHSSRGLSRVYSESCRKKGQCRRTCEEVNSVVSAGGVSGGDGSYCVPSREPGSRQGIDITLFQTWGVTPQEHAFVIENILLFVPFGVLFPLAVAGSKNGDGRAVDRLSKCTVLFGFLCSVCIETVQLITERGYCQLDDVVMNTLGSLAGYIIFLIIKKMKNIKKMEE